MRNISKEVSPIRQVFLNTPLMVWNFYMEKLSALLTESNLNTYEKSNFRQTVIRHANGERGAAAIRTINIFLRRSLENAWPVSTSFFEGTPEEMSAAAQETAEKMTEYFEEELSQQKAALPL